MTTALLVCIALASGDVRAGIPARTEAAQVQALRAHYAAVVGELEAADSSRLTDVRRVARRQVIDALRAYLERVEFGRAPSAREPWFVDAEGRRCAVAELLHATGEDAFVERVRATANHAWILELSRDAEFRRWLDAHGLGFDEAARIQTPVIHHPNGDTVPTTDPARPTSPGPVIAGPSPGDSAKGGGSTSSGGPKSANGIGAASLATTSDDTWWLWWEYAKLEFLAPNRAAPAAGPATGPRAPSSLHDAIERARAAELPHFVAATHSTDALLRAAAATALGACGGRDAVEPLKSLLDDPNQDVRHRAIVGLGATGTSSGAVVLLRIARSGRLTDEASSDISPYARSLSIVGLGLARRAGLDDSIDAVVRGVVRERSGGERDALAVAAMFHQVIAPSKALEELALELAQDERESPSVRCRAVEALGSTRDPETLAKLQTWLVGPRLDVRRSAALALGVARDASVLPALITAYELEAESLTRGLVLIAVGRIGGARAHALLSKVVAAEDSSDRRWAALALGVLARDTRDPETAKLLRAALEREKNSDGRAAFWLACGLVGDDGSTDLVARELANAPDPRQRMYAATALTLIGGSRAAALLRERMPHETSAAARVGIAQGLGILGEPADARTIRDALERLNEPALQGIAATSLAFHGSFEALAQLAEMSVATTGPDVRRASSIEGLGLLLARARPLVLADVSRRMNYTVMPDWAYGLFQTTL